MADGELSWDGFAEALAQVLPSLQERSYLVVSWGSVPTVYVQFAQTASQLQAKTGAGDVMPANRQIGSADTDVMRSSGWLAPEQDAGSRNTWHSVLPWPARSADYHRVAQMAVAVLRDAHRVPSPDVLEHRAWREAEPDPVGVTFYEDDLEPLEPHLEFPELRIRDGLAT